MSQDRCRAKNRRALQQLGRREDRLGESLNQQVADHPEHTPGDGWPVPTPGHTLFHRGPTHRCIPLLSRREYLCHGRAAFVSADLDYGRESIMALTEVPSRRARRFRPIALLITSTDNQPAASSVNRSLPLARLTRGHHGTIPCRISMTAARTPRRARREYGR